MRYLSTWKRTIKYVATVAILASLPLLADEGNDDFHEKNFALSYFESAEGLAKGKHEAVRRFQKRLEERKSKSEPEGDAKGQKKEGSEKASLVTQSSQSLKGEGGGFVEFPLEAEKTAGAK